MKLAVAVFTLLFITMTTAAVPDGTSSYQPALVMVCGRVTQHRDLNTGEWISDESGHTDCIEDNTEKLNYCSKVYSSLSITNIVEESEKVHVSSWCHIGSQPPCKGHAHNVNPVSCIVGEYKPRALEVDEGCTFEHTHDYETCHSPQYWEKNATGICRSQGKTASKFQMLKTVSGLSKSCLEVDEWQGVQFLCCETPALSKPRQNKAKAKEMPKPANIETIDRITERNPNCMQPMKLGLCRATLPAWFFNSATEECEFFHYGGCGGNDNNFQSRTDCESVCQPGKSTNVPEPDNSLCGLRSDAGRCLAYFQHYYYDATEGVCKMFVFGGCGGNANNFNMKDDCEAKCKGYKIAEIGSIQIEPPVNLPMLEPGPVLLNEVMKPMKDEVTTTTPEPTTLYTDATTIGNEHDVFVDNLEKLKTEHQDKVTEILQKWDEDNAHLSSQDKERLDELEETLQGTISALEDEYDEKMSSLNQYHKDRMSQMINEERTKTLKKFLDLLKADRPKFRHILTALEKYITVERHDKSHVMQHYYMAVHDDFDEASIPEFKNQLNEIDDRVNKTRTLLNNYPDVLARIQQEVEDILSSMPSSPDFDTDDENYDDIDEEVVDDIDDDVYMTTVPQPIKIDDGGIPDPDSICALPAVVGPCRASFPAFHYDSEEQKCRMFVYGGCGGNENNFDSMEECQTSCPGDGGRSAGKSNVFDYIDTNGVMIGEGDEYVLPTEEEFDIGADKSDLEAAIDELDNYDDDNSIKSSLTDEELAEDETLLDESVDKLFEYNGDRRADFDADQPLPLFDERLNKASITTHWVMWVGMGAGILFITIVIIVIVVRRNANRPPMRIVVDKPEDDEKELSPEEKQLLALQQNGYENPTYKFFEKQMA